MAAAVAYGATRVGVRRPASGVRWCGRHVVGGGRRPQQQGA